MQVYNYFEIQQTYKAAVDYLNSLASKFNRNPYDIPTVGLHEAALDIITRLHPRIRDSNLIFDSITALNGVVPLLYEWVDDMIRLFPYLNKKGSGPRITGIINREKTRQMYLERAIAFENTLG